MDQRKSEVSAEAHVPKTNPVTPDSHRTLFMLRSICNHFSKPLTSEFRSSFWVKNSQEVVSNLKTRMGWAGPNHLYSVAITRCHECLTIFNVK